MTVRPPENNKSVDPGGPRVPPNDHLTSVTDFLTVQSFHMEASGYSGFCHSRLKLGGSL